MAYLAVMAGIIAGSVQDPVFIALVVAAAVAALVKWRYWLILPLVLAGAVIRTVLMINARAAIGLEPGILATWIGPATAIAMLTVFGLALLLRWCLRDPYANPSRRA